MPAAPLKLGTVIVIGGRVEEVDLGIDVVSVEVEGALVVPVVEVTLVVIVVEVEVDDDDVSGGVVVQFAGRGSASFACARTGRSGGGYSCTSRSFRGSTRIRGARYRRGK